MIAVGADPARTASGAGSALDYLAARQASDGHYRYSTGSDQTPVWVTGEALVGAAGDALPISPPPREKKVTTVAPSKAAPSEKGAAPTAPPAEVLPESKAGTDEEGGTGVPPAATPTVPPASGGTVPLPGTTGGVSPEGATEAASPESSAPAPAPEPIAASGSAPSPGVPIGIGALATALAIGIPWLLGRRFAW